MNLTTLVQQQQNQLSPMDQDIVAFFLEHEQEIMGMNIMELSNKVHCSKSSILRLTKKLGFSGYSEFKFFLKENYHLDTPITHDNLTQQTIDIENTLKLAKQTNFNPIVEVLYQAENVYCYGTGFCQKNALQEFSMSLLSCNKRSLVLPAKTELNLNMPLFTKKDLVIFGSLSGNTPDIQENIQMLKLRKIPILGISRFSQNYLGANADYNLFYAVTPLQISRLNNPVESLVTMDILLDCLFRHYLEYINKLEVK